MIPSCKGRTDRPDYPFYNGLPVAAGPAAFLLRLVPTIPQLIGEELLTILPFLALLWASLRMGLSRQTGLILALVGSTLLFSAAHLPTYDWNLIQCFIGIGIARLVLTAGYMLTRNLWVSAGAHILNDWTGFISAFALSHGPIGMG